MKTKTIMSTGAREDLVKMINEYYYSKNYIITEDNRIYNTKTEKRRNLWTFSTKF